MASSTKLKASEKQAICKKIVTALKKRYKASLPKHDFDVLDTLVYGICLENADDETARAAFDRIGEVFHDLDGERDLNELRVSGISEVAVVFDGMPDADWKAMRIRSTLQHVFETTILSEQGRKLEDDPFDLEPLKKKTHDLAGKHLAKFRDLTPFVRNYTLQQGLGGHVVPLDERMRKVIVWFGLVEPGDDCDAASEALKSALRKSDAPLFAHLVRQLASDDDLRKAIEREVESRGDEPFDPTTAVERLEELTTAKKKSSRKSASGRKKASTSRKKSSKASNKSSSNKSSKKSKSSKTGKSGKSSRKTASRK